MKGLPFAELWADERRRATTLILIISSIAFGAAAMFLVNRFVLPGDSSVASSAKLGHDDAESHEHDGGHDEELGVVTLPKEKWDVAGLRIQQVERRTLSGSTWVTGKLALNEDRLAHIYSLADGQVHSVEVQFGDDVKQGQTLAVIDSKEVGTAKLNLHRDRLDAEFARVNSEWARKISTNTQELIRVLTTKPPIDTIEKAFVDKPMGAYRQQLMTAYASLYKSRKDLERLEPLASQGVAAGKQALAAKAILEADRASFQALLEQLKFTTPQQALLADQKVQQAEQAVATSRSNLFILGYHHEDLTDFDPLKEGEAIAHYRVKAPFDGTVIKKNVVLAERVGPDTEMFQIADLSTLWVQADIYQKDLPKLDHLGDTLRFLATNSSHEHTAKIFYSGDILDPETRTIRLTAVVKNPKRHLKVGMFVEVALPGKSIEDVVAVPVSALQEIDGKAIVFVQTTESQFEKRRVILGSRSSDMVQIREGLQAGDQVVVAGGFALKSELMKGSISHGH